jgi:hypothetical protein
MFRSDGGCSEQVRCRPPRDGDDTHLPALSFVPCQQENGPPMIRGRSQAEYSAERNSCTAGIESVAFPTVWRKVIENGQLQDVGTHHLYAPSPGEGVMV